MSAWRTIPCLALAALLVAAGHVHAQSQPATQPQRVSPVPAPPRVVAPDMALRLAIDQLREEGQTFRRSGDLPRQQPDFAESFAHRVRAEDVIEAICEVQDREDAAVDAYIRWQLLSFDVDLSVMDDATYERLLARLPRLARSPSANIEMHGDLERLALGAGRNADVKAELEQRWDAVHFEDKQVELLNQPALKFRELVADAMPETGMRRVGVLLFDLQGRIAAACDTRGVKTRLTKTLRERMNDDTISLEQRWKLIRYVEQLPGDETKIVRDVVFYATQPADVRYSTYTIRSTDVKKWTAYLNRHEP